MKKFVAAVNASRALLVLNAVLLFFLVNAVAAKINLRLDLSRGGLNSLTESTSKVLGRISDRILVEAYISQDLSGDLLSQIEPIRTQLREIERVGGDRIFMRVVNPVSEEERQQAQRRGIRGLVLRQAKVDESSAKLIFLGVYVQIGEKSGVIPLVSEDQQGIVDDFEYRFLRQVKKLSRKQEAAEVGFATGAGLFTLEQPQRRPVNKENMFYFKYLFEQDQGLLRAIPLTSEVPSDISTLLVVGMPDFSPIEQYNLDQFLLRGGNLVVLVSGNRFSLAQSDPRLRQFGMDSGGQAFASVPEEQVAKLNSWLGGYGVTVRPELLVELEQYVETYDLGMRYADRYRNPVWLHYTKREDNLSKDHPALANLQDVVIPWGSGLERQDARQPQAKFEDLVRSSTGAIPKKTLNLAEVNLHSLRPEAADRRTGVQVPVAVLASGRFRSLFRADSLPPGVARDRFRPAQAVNSESRLIVIGSSHLLSDALLQRQENAEVFRLNFVFLLNLLEAASGDTDLLAARSRVRSLAYLANVGPGFQSAFKWFHILFLPILLAVWGTLRLTRRNRRIGLAAESEGAAAGSTGESTGGDS